MDDVADFRLPQTWRAYRVGVHTGSSRSHAIIEKMARSIVSGRYPREGESVTEAELCRHFGVARGSLRDAICILRSKGLVDRAPRHGVWVEAECNWNLLDTDVLRWFLNREPSADTVKDLAQMRLALQPTAASLAASTCRDDARHAVAMRMSLTIANSSGTGTIAGIMDFHAAILKATGNQFFERLVGVVTMALLLTDKCLNGLLCSSATNARLRGLVAQSILDTDPSSAEQQMRGLIQDEQAMLNALVERSKV